MLVSPVEERANQRFELGFEKWCLTVRFFELLPMLPRPITGLIDFHLLERSFPVPVPVYRNGEPVFLLGFRLRKMRKTSAVLAALPDPLHVVEVNEGIGPGELFEVA